MTGHQILSAELQNKIDQVKHCLGDIDWLLNQAMNDVCGSGLFPDGWEIHIKLRNDEAEIDLLNADGESVSAQWDGDCQSVSYFLKYMEGMDDERED